MTGFLGYDPERVVALRRALGAALAEAATLRCADPAAADASERWRRATGLMAPWEPRLAAIVSCTFDTPYRPVTVRDELPLDHRRADRAWTVVHDPHDGPLPALDALARVDELLALLLAVDATLLADAADAGRLREILTAVLGDPAARRLLFDQLGPTGFAETVDRLARLVVADVDERVVPSARALLAQLSMGLGVSVQRGEESEADIRAALLDGPTGDPHLLAMVLRDAGLPTPVVVVWARALLQRAEVVGPGGLGALVTVGGERTGELLLQALTANPFAGREVLRGLDELDVLLGSHLDGDLRGRFLATVTDPSRFLRSETLPMLTEVLGYLDEHRDVSASTVSMRDLHDWLGAVVGPWLLQLDLTSAATTWGASVPSDVVAWVAERPTAALDLVWWIGEHARRDLVLSGGTLDRLVDVGRALGTALEVVVRGRLSFALHRRSVYDGAVDGLEFVSGKAVSWALNTRFPPAKVVTPVIDKITEVAVGTMLDRFEDHGWTHPPDNPVAARQAIEHEASVITTGVLHLVAVRASGRVDGGSTAPPSPGVDEDPTSYVHRVERWSRGDPGRRSALETVAAVDEAMAEGREATGDELPARRSPVLESDLTDNTVSVRTGTRP